MERRNFLQVLQEAKIDIKREYDRLYFMFYTQKASISGVNLTLREYCANSFINSTIRGTCISLDDFDDFYNFHFERSPNNLDEVYLINFCEYTLNLILHSYTNPMMSYGPNSLYELWQLYYQQLLRVIDLTGYMSAQNEDITILVPKSPVAVSVSEMIDPAMSYKVIEYNHHSLKGNISKKQAILKQLADIVEGKRGDLCKVSSTLYQNLSTLFNNLNIRHNNVDTTSPNYHEIIANLSNDELEQWYDDTYQLCLQAFIMMDNASINARAKELRISIKGG